MGIKINKLLEENLVEAAEVLRLGGESLSSRKTLNIQLEPQWNGF